MRLEGTRRKLSSDVAALLALAASALAWSELHPALPCGRCDLKRSCHGVRCVDPALQRRGSSRHLWSMLMNLSAITGRTPSSRSRWHSRALTRVSATLMRFGPLQRLPVVPHCPVLPASGRSRFDVAPGGDWPLLKAKRRQPRAVLAVFRKASGGFRPGSREPMGLIRKPSAADHASPI